MKNFALIGASGYIAKRHMQAILETNNNLLLAYDPSDSVGIIDNFFPKCKFFTQFECFYNYAQELNNSKKSKIDFVSICSPNYLHYPHITTSLRLNSHVICEKPLVPTLDLLEKLKNVENKTDKKVFTILQLRHHDAVIELKKEVQNFSKTNKFHIELTYITSRGDWYLNSWKNDPQKGFGLTTNIGIHFFDMLHFIFGKLINYELHHTQEDSSAGFLEFERAKIKWYLSINENHLPKEINERQKTFRKIEINGKSFEFSKGFTDLHTTSYRNIFNGNGFNIKETEDCIRTVEKIRNLKPKILDRTFLHPLAKFNHEL